MESGLFAGNTALMDLRIQVLIALSPLLTVEVLAMLLGKKTNAIKKTHKGVKNMDLYGTLNVQRDSTLLDAVSALQSVPMEWLILVFHARRTHMVEAQATLLDAEQMRNTIQVSAILLVRMDMMELVQYAGLNALQI